MVAFPSPTVNPAPAVSRILAEIIVQRAGSPAPRSLSLEIDRLLALAGALDGRCQSADAQAHRDAAELIRAAIFAHATSITVSVVSLPDGEVADAA